MVSNIECQVFVLDTTANSVNASWKHQTKGCVTDLAGAKAGINVAEKNGVGSMKQHQAQTKTIFGYKFWPLSFLNSTLARLSQPKSGDTLTQPSWNKKSQNQVLHFIPIALKNPSFIARLFWRLALHPRAFSLAAQFTLLQRIEIAG